MNRIVISQPMFFPWIGLFEQIRLCNRYVHYDDVQFSKGSFSNRVQIKTPHGVRWLTVPLASLRLGQRINECMLATTTDWRQRHLDLLAQSYSKAPFKFEMIELVEAVYRREHRSLAMLSADSIESVCAYFGLSQGFDTHWSSNLSVSGAGTERVLSIVKLLDGSAYVTGHGARHYFDHELAESLGIAVEYMKYNKAPYPQLHGDFTPYVSVLDLIANVGKDGLRYISSNTMMWRSFLTDQQALIA